LASTHQEQVHVHAVAAPELRHGAAVEAFDDLVDELLGADVEEPGLRLALDHALGDRLHQVGLAQPGGAVNEEWVVGLAGGLGRGVAGRGRELVRLADDEGVEGVTLVERLAARVPGGRPAIGGFAGRATGARRWGRDEEVHLGTRVAIPVNPEHDGGRLADHRLSHLRQQRRVLGLVPLPRELIGCSDD
jgi:hypothetical protein